MFCGKCGKQVPDDAPFCVHCETEITPVSAAPQPSAPAVESPPTSRRATASLVLGALGIVTFGLTSVFGVIVGIISLRQIRRSQGRVQGREMAVAGMAISGAMVLLIVVFSPTLIRHRERAQQCTCVADAKKLSVAMLMYVQDQDLKLPPKADWCDAIMPYVKSDRVYVCPARSHWRCGYAFNEKLGARPLLSIQSPADTFELFDAKGGTWNLSGGTEIADPRHGGEATVACVDGHVDWWKGQPPPTRFDPGPPAASPPSEPR